MTVEDLYHRAAATPGDIYEHVPTLRALATGCEHVTEFGTRSGVSTVALLSGKPRTMVAYDLGRHPAVADIEEAAMGAGIEFRFVEADVLTVDIEPTDLLFVDTLHTYEQLAAELRLHADKVRRHCVFHDTQTYGTVGEDSGYGLSRALREHFSARSEWRLTYYANNNGLSVYTR